MRVTTLDLVVVLGWTGAVLLCVYVLGMGRLSNLEDFGIWTIAVMLLSLAGFMLFRRACVPDNDRPPEPGDETPEKVEA